MGKADGTPIRKPKEYIAGIEKNGYSEPLFDALGKEIRDPVAYFNKAGSKDKTAAPQRKQEGSNQSSIKLYKEGGILIRNPHKYVEGIKKNGYTETIFTADGKEIKDPVAFLKMK